MCGIFGYVGKSEDAAQKVLDGLKLLEYRGYDSWGIAVREGDSLKVDKRVGKIGNATISLPKSSIGIGHTRWATHGGVTAENAHPHVSCDKKIAVAHNGIIENYEEIRANLKQKGHIFLSETDTEVAAHLIEENLKKHGFATSVRLAFNQFKGLSALVVLHTSSGEIIACKTGSPLVVGRGKDGYYIASDASGIVKHTRDVLFLKDFEMVILGKELQLLSISDGGKLKPKFEKITWIIEDAKLGDFDHFMVKEIYEQPTVIRNIAENYTEQIEHMAKVVQNAKGTFFIGAGTAFHACLAGTYLFSKIAKAHVNTQVASEFNYLEHFLTNRSLIIALSQSGETIDVIEPLQRAKNKKSKIGAITNVLGSSIYRMADYPLLLGAGPEKAVASTKAYVAKLCILLSLAYATQGKITDAKKLLLDAALEVERLLKPENQVEIKRIAKLLKNTEHIYTIGRSSSYPTALEAALKIKEVSYIHTEGLAGGELKHGTIALISKGTPCIVFAPKNETYSAMISNATEIKARGGVVIGVSEEESAIFDHWIQVKDVGEASIIPQVIPAQLLGYFLAVELGLDPDKPRNLAKSVTVK